MAKKADRRLIVLLSAPGTLEEIDPLLARAGIDLVRIPTVVPRPLSMRSWGPRVDRARAVDTVVVTSPAGVTSGVAPWLQRIGRPPGGTEFWAVGPATAQALRGLGLRGVRRPVRAGSAPLTGALRRKPPRTILSFRSDRAGPGLARALRKSGHRVLDLVTYRLKPLPRLPRGAGALLDRAELFVATSPSALIELRRWAGRKAFLAWTVSVRLVVLGDRSRRAASRQGFRRIAIVPPTTAQRFTHDILRVLSDADP